MDVGPSGEFFGDALLSPCLVADKGDDGVVGVAGEVGEECPLCSVSVVRVLVMDYLLLTPIPREAPVIA
jgi:hypothetical protein